MTREQIPHIMIVDDEELDRRICVRALKRAAPEWHVHSVADAAVALEWLADAGRPPVDLVLLDINMPAMGGLEFLERLEEINRPDGAEIEVAVLLTTALTSERRKRAENSSRVRAFLKKPLDVKEVLSLVARQQERRTQQQAPPIAVSVETSGRESGRCE